MARRRRSSRKGLWFLSILAIVAGGGVWFNVETGAPAEPHEETIVYMQSQDIRHVIDELASKGIVKSAFATKMLAVLRANKPKVSAGAYHFTAKMTAGEVLTALKSPVQQKVRIPEEKWIAQIAPILEKHKVCKATDYIALSNEASKFKDFGIPFFNESLEGFLYPDTYNLPPEVGAEWVIRRQLANFQKRTADLGLTEKNIRRTMIIASLLEKEASDYKEKQMIAGVIENRLMRGMKLQIDATVNYGLQIWRPLVYADYTNVKSPFKTYLVKGLPPGPICSPTVASIRAALHPIKHNMVYYITMPDGITRFSATYPEHLKNVKLRDTIKAQKR